MVGLGVVFSIPVVLLLCGGVVGGEWWHFTCDRVVVLEAVYECAEVVVERVSVVVVGKDNWRKESASA